MAIALEKSPLMVPTEVAKSAFSFHTLQAWKELQGIFNLKC